MNNNITTDTMGTDNTSIPSPYYYDWDSWKSIIGESKISTNKLKGDDDMCYLYEVILVNPKNDEFYIDRIVTKSETSALMKVYNDSPFNEKAITIKFDDLKTSCKILMSWKKEKSLKKAIETIKKAVE